MSQARDPIGKRVDALDRASRAAVLKFMSDANPQTRGAARRAAYAMRRRYIHALRQQQTERAALTGGINLSRTFALDKEFDPA